MKGALSARRRPSPAPAKDAPRTAAGDGGWGGGELRIVVPREEAG